MTRPLSALDVSFAAHDPSTTPTANAAPLLDSLRSACVIHPEEWDDLPRETRGQLATLQSDAALLDRLAELSLINDYQAGRIRGGSWHSLVLGNYRVLGSMGAGGSGVVFEAEHILMRRKVALKVFPVNPDQPPGLITRFLREMRAVSRLDHPNIVAAFDAGACPGHQPGEPDLYYFAMEHLSGKDLEQHVRDSALAIPAACALIYQIASALDEAHRHLLVHRDIKPSNIFVTVDRQAKLLDFGLVRHMLGDSFTMPNVVVGTLEYMAPEQAFDPTQVDIRTDIFGLGAVLFFTLIGTSPFPTEGTLMEAVLKRREQRPLSARALRADIPLELEQVIQRMLALRPEDRPATPQAVMHALLPFVEHHTGSSRHGQIDGKDRLSPVAVALGSKPSRALIVNADAGQRGDFAGALMASGLECVEVGDADGALRTIREEPVEAVLVATDLPGPDGRAVLKALRDNPPCPNLKIIFSSAGPADDMASLLMAGADDYLRLPISNVQLAARVKSAIKHKQVQDRTDELSRQLLEMNTELERGLGARTIDLVQARNALVLALARLVEYRSTETHAHLTRMQRYTTTLAQEAAGIASLADQIDPEFMQTLECCAPLHDIGNVGLPDHILLKAGRLDPEENQVMQTHTVIGADTLQNVAHRFGSQASFLRMAIDIARHHHEHYDGTGYPDRLAGNNIPLAARLLTIADAYDALRSRRAQRPGLSHAAALQIMLENSPGKFDPVLLGAFSRCAFQLERIFRELPDTMTLE
jgi:response regulator RpfG family c-di-GMP phosphodiesterase/serine/threonine protein kinase